MLPSIIMGGMAVNISVPSLVNTVCQYKDCRGTVTGTGAYIVLARILQRGDPGGHYRRALESFPYPAVAQQVLHAYYVPNGIPTGKPYQQVRPVTLYPSPLTIALIVCANYALVWLAKEGHDHEVSINYLEKVQLLHLHSIYGAMLADVSYVTMGAGIPLQIPDVLDRFSLGQAAEYRVEVSGGSPVTMRFDPGEYFGPPARQLRRPGFVPIVSSNLLADVLAQKLGRERIQEIVYEWSTAGGHNAPPRGRLTLNALNEPVYGPRDRLDHQRLTDLGIPWYEAGSRASPQALARARAAGASGIQVGSIMALSNGSGMDPVIRQTIIRLAFRGELRIFTSASYSPTGYPLKVALLQGSVSDYGVYRGRPRICNKHGLRTPYRLEDGTIVYRCPAEGLEDWERKGGAHGDAVDARCLCNGLFSTGELGDDGEPPIVTLGDDLSFLKYLVSGEDGTYTPEQALDYLLQ